MFKEFCKSADIQHTLIAAGSPQANGQVKRYKRTVKAMLSKSLHEKGKNWNVLLNIQFCINNIFNRSIKSTLSKILFCINQHGDSNDFLRLALEAEQNKDDENRDLDEIRNSAQENILDIHLPFLPQNSISPGGSKVRKLMATFIRKENYIVHFRNLQQAIKNGVIMQ